jgi:hypothetical protein
MVTATDTRNWKLDESPQFGFLNSVIRLTRSTEGTTTAGLPDLRRNATLFIGSDYSGSHKESDYNVFSFIIADFDAARRWTAKASTLRKCLLTDNRRLSFKKLNDKNIRRLLPFFLTSADSISGVLVSVAVSKKIESLFGSMGDHVATQELAQWKPHVRERLGRIAHFVSLFLSGLTGEFQNILWITDADDVIANQAMHRQFVKVFAWICSNYLSHTLGHLRIGSTASDTGKRDVEDLVAIPDFAAGTLSELITQQTRNSCLPQRLLVPLTSSCRPITARIAAWLSDSSRALKKVSFVIDPSELSEGVTVKLIHLRNRPSGAVDFPFVPR